jgi:hypothetical protein
MPVSVAATYKGPQGKISQYDTSVIIMEYRDFLQHLIKHIHPFIPPEARVALSEVNLFEYASFVVWNLPPPRSQNYIDTNSDVIQERLIRFASDLMYVIGFPEISIRLPVFLSLQQVSWPARTLTNNCKTNTFSFFLGLILSVVVIVLLLLAVILIYSLLTISVETKAFDMGILRRWLDCNFVPDIV